MQGLASNTTVKLSIDHNISSMKVIEARFDLSQSIMSVKQNIEARYGSMLAYLRLELKDSKGKLVAALEDDERPLGYYGAETGMVLHVIDTNPTSIHREIESYEGVDKYVMSESDYNNLPENFRKWKESLLKQNPDLIKQQQVLALKDPEYQAELARTINVGSRCKLSNGARGEVKYVGKIMDLGNGFYVGAKLDEPFGTGTGVVKGVKYFDASDKYGIFVRPDSVEQGDFPVLDLDDEI